MQFSTRISFSLPPTLITLSIFQKKEKKMETQNSKSDYTETLKMAIAMAVLKSKLLVNQNPQSNATATTANNNNNNTAVSSSNSQLEDALKWKRKAKERKLHILRLQEDLKVAEDGMQYDLFPQNASCKCYFYDNMGLLGENQLEDNCYWRFNDVLRRRFLRQVRVKDRKRQRDAGQTQKCVLGTNGDNDIEQLSASVDFLVELCDIVSPVNVEGKTFDNWSHQAVDFILATLKALLPMGNNMQTIEGIINSLIMRLLRRMCNSSQGDGKHLNLQNCDKDAHFYVQHLIRKLGSEPYLGQRLILSVSQGISTAAESLLFMDPFDDAFPNMHNCMYMMIQLIEFLVSDYLIVWSTREEDFEMGLFEDWFSSLLHGRKALELLESRNALYVLYMDRVIGGIAKRVIQFTFFEKLNPNIHSLLFS